MNQVESSAAGTFSVGDFDNPSELAHALEQMENDGYLLVSMVTAAIGRLLDDDSPPHTLATRVVWAKRPRAPLPRGVN